MNGIRLPLSWLIKNADALKIGAGLSDLSSETVRGFSTDSRTVKRGEVFVALVGDKFDGHLYVGEAIKNGAVAVVVHSVMQGESGQLSITVPDTLKALGDLARALRRERKLQVIGLTGSNGKTTTKELLVSIFKLKDPFLLATTGNFNNHVGLPLTVFQLRRESRLAILEMGANHFGEIAYLTKIAEPDVGLINSVGAAHLENFGTIAKVAKAKGELYAGLGPAAMAIVNADEPLLVRQAKLFAGNKLFFGTGGNAQVKLGRVRPLGLTGQQLKLYGPGAEKGREIVLKLLGMHNARNALAAAAAALAAGADWDMISEGLEMAESYPGRLHAFKTNSGRWVLDDSYNANPTSMAAGLKVLAESDFKGSRGAILGDMGELGSGEKKYHRQLGCLAAQLKLDFLACVGPLASLTARTAVKGGLNKKNVAEFASAEDAADWVIKTKPLQSAILVKGSRFMKLEKAVDRLSNADI